MICLTVQGKKYGGNANTDFVGKPKYITERHPERQAIIPVHPAE